ncbi:hypothetical protein YC2023_076013 [Brassica napus]
MILGSGSKIDWASHLSIAHIKKNTTRFNNSETTSFIREKSMLWDCGVSGLSQGYGLCENDTEYLFFDSFHLTEKAHRQIAELIWSGPSNVTARCNLKTLFELK